VRKYKFLGSIIAVSFIFGGCENIPTDINQQNFSIDSSVDTNISQSVGISNNYAIVGANEKAYIFNINSQDVNASQVVLSVGQNGSKFGHSVAISDNYALVGAPSLDNNTGVAYLFNLNASNINGSYQKLTAYNLQNGNEFGYSVAINDKYAIVGSPRESGKGVVYIFELNATDINSSQKDIKANDNSGNGFGKTLAVKNYKLVVGAPYETGNNGDAYLFDLNSSDINASKKSVSQGEAEGGEFFGSSVAINDNYVLIGSLTKNKAKLYEINSSSSTPAKTFDNVDNLGYSVALTNDYAIVGKVDSVEHNGTVFIYKFDSTTSYNKLVYKNRNQGDYFGYSLAANEENLIVGGKGSSNISKPALFKFNKLDLSFIVQSKWNMISVPMDKNVSVSDITNATIWTYDNNLSSWIQPQTLTGGAGYWLYTTDKSNYANITTTNNTLDYNSTFGLQNLEDFTGKWHFMGVSGMNNSYDKNISNTAGLSIGYLQLMFQLMMLQANEKVCNVNIFSYDSENNSWNTREYIPSYGGYFLKIDNCINGSLGLR
jgi:hypothetical protein